MVDVFCCFFFFYIERPLSKTTPTAHLQSCKMDLTKNTPGGRVKNIRVTWTCGANSPLSHDHLCATDQQDGRHEFLHKHGRAHGGLQPAPLGAKKQVHVVVITPCPKLNQGPNQESRNFMFLRHPRNGQTRRCKTSSRVYISRFRLKTTPSPPMGRAEMKLQSKADRAKVPMFMWRGDHVFRCWRKRKTNIAFQPQAAGNVLTLRSSTGKEICMWYVRNI